MLTCRLGKDGAFLVEGICRVNGEASRCKERMNMHAAILLNCLQKNRNMQVTYKTLTSAKRGFPSRYGEVDCTEKSKAVGTSNGIS